MRDVTKNDKKHDISKRYGLIMTQLGGWVGSVTWTSWLLFASGLYADPVFQWDTKCKLFILAEVWALTGAPLVVIMIYCLWSKFFLQIGYQSSKFMTNATIIFQVYFESTQVMFVADMHLITKYENIVSTFVFLFSVYRQIFVCIFQKLLDHVCFSKSVTEKEFGFLWCPVQRDNQYCPLFLVFVDNQWHFNVAHIM